MSNAISNFLARRPHSSENLGKRLRLGVLAGVTPPELAERQGALLERFGLPSTYTGVAAEAVLEAMTHDKKAAAGALRWVLLEAAGRAAVHGDVSYDDVVRVVTDLGGG